MTLLTVYVLLGDDLRLAFFTKKSDISFNFLTCVCIFLFMIEIGISGCAQLDYWLGFWFFCDLLAAVSLVFDLTFVSEAIMGLEPINVDPAGVSEYARASRAGRVGTRVARLLRVVRLVRLSRIMKAMQWNLLKMKFGHSKTWPGHHPELADMRSESRVGRELSERTTQRVICLVLAMLMVVPQIQPGFSELSLESNSAHYGANMIFQAWRNYELIAETNGSNTSLLHHRHEWEMQLLSYVYYHNWHASCPANVSPDSFCVHDWLCQLCWIGYVRNHEKAPQADRLDLLTEAYIQSMSDFSADWDDFLSGSSSVGYIVGSLPNEIKARLSRPWTTDCIEVGSKDIIRGVSLIEDIPCPRSALRLPETSWYVPTVRVPDFFHQHMEGQFVFVFDLRRTIWWEAILGIVQTVLVVVVLAIGALVFSRDADQLVLLPIERMLHKVDMIRRNPLFAIQMSDQLYKPANSKSSTRPVATQKRAAIKKVALETMILENAIIKLGSLLALGFGEAGSEIIGQNLDNRNATVDALVPGSKVQAVYGWCGIRHFATVTELLQEKTMVFVNQVAAIVHRVVDEHLGAANKNLGEAFLLVWRIGLYEQEMQAKVADLAVMSFVQVVAELNRDRQLAQYREHPALLARLPNFRVSLGFGLHLGWSIEGAIGSEFKIDASYLSPHVNIACSLEAATTKYRVIILMSEPLVISCNPTFSSHFRPIDNVQLQGSKTPIRLFTVDLNPEAVPLEGLLAQQWRKGLSRFEGRRAREQVKEDIVQKKYQVHEVFTKNKDVRRMRAVYQLDFFQAYERAYLNYEAGEWDVAAQVFRKAKALLWDKQDGPSSVLLEYMRSFGFVAPVGWPGWHELCEK